ncbi:autoinducer binding domain-containing protein [Trinickia fusca]|uniref:LuxR family transcriptional regulator n=1 Tax=Trinickia fusca TaxID=2419777 RepID=A0A494X8E4_9BURK|nr:autoinducer binding domain-containing protein [Trinickia fusca]RKP46997.1 LuxR family transcriptional regulator [Trinickia fusca]
MTDLSQAKDAEEILAFISARVRSLGFDFCAYGARDPLPVTRPSFTLHSNYPANWQKHYVAENYFARDPVVRYGVTYTSPLIWPVNARTDEAFWQDAKGHGLAHGWSQPIRDKQGRIAMWSFARGADPISTSEISASESRLIFLAHAGHSASSRLIPAHGHGIHVDHFTAREKEVLKWAADGKTAIEIASILSISERTITFHMQNIMEKLNSVNKTQAIVKAVLLGVIYEMS